MPRRPSASPLPPPLELCCLSALWSIGEGTVRHVHELLKDRHTLAYTTVLTLMDRLVKRGFATKRKFGRSFVYSPTQLPGELREAAVNELVNQYFGGSRIALRDWLLASGNEADDVKTAEAAAR